MNRCDDCGLFAPWDKLSIGEGPSYGYGAVGVLIESWCVHTNDEDCPARRRRNTTEETTDRIFPTDPERVGPEDRSAPRKEHQ